MIDRNKPKRELIKVGVIKKTREEGQYQTERDDMKACRKVDTQLGWVPQKSQPTTAHTKLGCHGEALV